MCRLDLFCLQYTTKMTYTIAQTLQSLYRPRLGPISRLHFSRNRVETAWSVGNGRGARNMEIQLGFPHGRLWSRRAPLSWKRKDAQHMLSCIWWPTSTRLLWHRKREFPRMLPSTLPIDNSVVAHRAHAYLVVVDEYPVVPSVDTHGGRLELMIELE